MSASVDPSESWLDYGALFHWNPGLGEWKNRRLLEEVILNFAAGAPHRGRRLPFGFEFRRHRHANERRRRRNQERPARFRSRLSISGAHGCLLAQLHMSGIRFPRRYRRNSATDHTMQLWGSLNSHIGSQRHRDFGRCLVESPSVPERIGCRSRIVLPRSTSRPFSSSTEPRSRKNRLRKLLPRNSRRRTHR